MGIKPLPAIGTRLNEIAANDLRGLFVKDRFHGLYGEIEDVEYFFLNRENKETGKCEIIVNSVYITIRYKRENNRRNPWFSEKLQLHKLGHVEITDQDRARATLYGNFNTIVHKALARLLGG